MNLALKGEKYFNAVEGMGTMLKRAVLVGNRFSRDTLPFAITPNVTPDDWKKAQKLCDKGWFNLAYKLNNGAFVVPSEKLITDMVPKELSTVEAKRAHIKTWALEFQALQKNPSGYKKLKDGSWDFDIFMDRSAASFVFALARAAHLSMTCCR